MNDMSSVTSGNHCACLVCQKNIGPRVKALISDLCEGWIHLKCTKIDKDKYEWLSSCSSPFLKILCTDCTNANKRKRKETDSAANQSPCATSPRSHAEVASDATNDPLRAAKKQRRRKSVVTDKAEVALCSEDNTSLPEVSNAASGEPVTVCNEPQVPRRSRFRRYERPIESSEEAAPQEIRGHRQSQSSSIFGR
ncbi:hypothetical protein FGIG_11834 [Fasciola gigantica]|uniref:PHD-type domain-containing protein n=1 Tax=Fasciola gigantica TaxID=46835 RepID=A0A504WS73_FASGI|nr:hypothetical protein FGIG_11834 [Fasciola gigantica]